MTYTIKEVSEITGLSIYTLRFYDKKGLLPFVARNDSGYREFTEGDLNLIHTICCLKDTGMKIDKIREYIDDVMQGTSSINHRVFLLNEHKKAVLDEMDRIQQNLAEIDYKLNMYESPDATKKVSEELAYAINEKQVNQLANPYPANK
ncbi:MerR family transcriptional regulator [Lentilactobacillus sp. SPB1-3]|uniref:MerR family transcriptional regulator n=1 Tax=Lentilactobacillus terminaliae TaxID=3003483 RepID=A0ACD5DFN9_9LACO|nr:MerR family transcriptional regulator [Lentilactobacillus sp. SPB1-3]MCZ0976489.1 MerR family transcriptional regulator [Lentilactobacillus sp. SPB1-3]